MGNKDKSQNRSMIDQESNRLLTEDRNFNNKYSLERANERDVATNQRNDIYGGYKALTDPNALNTMFGLGGAGTSGKYSPTKYNPATAKLSGYIGEAANAARGLASGGSWDPMIRKGYQDFATNGGLSATDIANIRSRATSVAPSFFEALKNQMSQRMTAAGVNAGSIFSAASDRAARMGAQAAQENALNAETDIAAQQREGRLAGLSGLFGLDEAGNRFRGQGMEGLLGAGSAENEMNQYNTSTLNDAAKFNASQATSASAHNAGVSRENAEAKYRAYMSGLGGMMDVYTSSPSELSRYDNLLMNNRELTGGQIGANIGRRMQNSQLPGFWDRATNILGAGAGLASAFFDK